MSGTPMSKLELRVLRALPMNTGRSEWPALAIVAQQAGVSPVVARDCLDGLPNRYLVEHGSSGSFACTHRGEQALERGVDIPSPYTMYGPTDAPGQPCSECGIPAPAPTPAPDGAAGQGWSYDEDEHGFGWDFLCPECQADEAKLARWQARRAR
jgi:hypothetical protein